MEEFGRHYYSCNSKKYGTNLGHASCGMNVTKLKSPDSIITLAFAIMMLNTDLHTTKIKGKFFCTKELLDSAKFKLQFLYRILMLWFFFLS